MQLINELGLYISIYGNGSFNGFRPMLHYPYFFSFSFAAFTFMIKLCNRCSIKDLPVRKSVIAQIKLQGLKAWAPAGALVVSHAPGNILK